MTIGKSIRIYLADSNVSGIRYAELVNWTGQAVACPRNRLSELKDWPECAKPGVYFLFEGRFGGSKPIAYIGESENVAERLTKQDKDREFWSEAIIFTSKDENLTKSHIKYLESSLVVISKDADRYTLENGNQPTESSLPRADRDAMLEYIENTRMVLGTLGYSILEPILNQSGTKSDANESSKLLTSLTFTVNNITAYGVTTDEGFVLKEGSQLSTSNSESMPGRLSTIKQLLLDEGSLKEEGGVLIATVDIPFNSSSYAAAIVAGTSRSGPQSWKNKKGKTLKQLEDEELKDA